MESLLQSSYFALFLIVALGFILGRINFKGISLDVSAVIFIALLFGHFGVIIPKELGNFGLVLFIFTIGMQAGPGFFTSFKAKGKVLAIITLLIVATAALTGIASKYLFDIDTPSVVGLIAGALTSTPGLAAAIDATGSSSSSIAYGIAYPFGGIIRAEEKRLEALQQQQYPEIKTAVFRVSNPNAFDKSLADLQIRTMTGAVVSRLVHDNLTEIPTPLSVLREGNLIKAVGSPNALRQLEILVGEKMNQDLPLGDSIDMQYVLLTNKEVAGKSLGSLNLHQNYHCTVTRVRRSGIDVAPSPDLVLRFGDKLTVIARKESMKDVLNLLGNDKRRLSDTDFFPIAMGIVLGVLFGKVNISFSDSFTFSPGLTGGILIVALVLGYLGKTGPIVWSMSGPANQLLRQLGLLLFLAEVGTSAGVNLVQTFVNSGLTLFGVGFAITLLPMIVALLVGYYGFRINILDLMGTITGGMTSTPGLAAADSMTDSNIPSVAYATVYPIAMVVLIICIQLLSMLI